MKCLDRSDLQRYLDGELSANDRQRFEKHLKECPFCTDQYNVVENRSRALKTLLSTPLETPSILPPLPSGVDGNLPVYHTDNKAQVSRLPLLRHWAYWASAACLIGTFFLLKPLVCQSQSREMVYMHPEIVEVDANQPYMEQERELVIIEPSGNTLTYME